MKRPSLSPSSTLSSAAFLAGALLIPTGLRAAQLAYDGFNYPAGTGNLSGQAGGSGWNGSWATVNNGSADVTTGSLSGGAPAGVDARSIGNSVVLPNNRRVGRSLDTTITGILASKGYLDANGRIGADGKTIYISFFQKPDGTSNYYEFELHRGDLGDLGRIAGIGNDQPGDNVNLRAPNNVHTPIGAGSTDVNFYVVRIDFKAGNDDVYVYRNPTSTTQPATATLTRLAAADMSFDGISFGAFNNGRTVAHDEIRVGESWADVTVPPVSTPAFTAQPKATTNSYVGSTVTLSATASGEPAPAYQWFKGSTALTGQTGQSLTLTNVQSGDAGTYHVTATNSQGTATSNDAQVTVATAPAGLFVYEGFDYSAGAGNLPGLAGGIGWGAGWSAVNGGGSSVQAGSLAGGTNSPNGYDGNSTGNSLYMPNAHRDGRLVDTSPTGRLGTAGYIDGSGNVGADGKTLYISFLQQPDGATKFYEFELHRGDLGDPGRIGGVGNDTGNPVVSLRTGGTQTPIGPASTGVNLYVVRIDFKPGNDDVYVYQNPVSATEPGTPTLTMLGASDMSFNGISLAAFDNGRTVKHDEIRLGQSWSDVVFGTSRSSLTWAGDGTANVWNFTAANWKAGAGAIPFVDGNPVTFDDTGSATPAISVPANVATGSLTATNSTKNYTINGPGTINVSGGLTKSGTGSLTLGGPVNFGSAITVSSGALALNGTTSAGGGVTVNGGTATLGGTSSLGGLIGGADPVTPASGVINLTGATTISGAGALVWMGSLPGADTAVTIGNGASLTMTTPLADSWVIGRDGGNGSFTQNGGTVTYNPSNRAEAYIGASIPETTVAAYNMKGGTLEMSTKNLEVALGPITANLNQSGGNINVNALTLGANLSAGGGTGVFTQTGGTITIGAGGISSISSLYQIGVSGGTIAAAADWSGALDMTLNAGTTTFDTGSHVVTVPGWLSGNGALTKTGTGSLYLTGFNSHTGATTVSAGTLGGSGTGEGSAVTVASGASIAPGDNAFNPVSTFAAKTVTFASGSSLRIDIDSTAAFSDQLTGTGTIALNGATLTLNEVAGGTLPLGTNLVIIQAPTVSGTFAGLAEGTKIGAGTNTFQIHYQSNQVSLTTVAGNAYNTWAASKGLDGTPGKDAAFASDPDGDGVINGLEWILGGNPLSSDASALYTVTGTAASGLTLSFTREEASIPLTTLTAQWSTTLTSWTDVPVVQAGGSYTGGITVTADQAATPDKITIQIPASNAANGKLFVRLKATQP